MFQKSSKYSQNFSGNYTIMYQADQGKPERRSREEVIMIKSDLQEYRLNALDTLDRVHSVEEYCEIV